MTDDHPESRRPWGQVSWTRNGEDVVLMRGLNNIAHGRFVEIQTDDGPEVPAMKAFLDLGWTGVIGRAGDLDRALATAVKSPPTDDQVHVAFIAADLTAADLPAVHELASRRPWVIVLGVLPIHLAQLTSALIESRYTNCLYDGVSAYFVADDHLDQLRPNLSYPACARDNYLPRAAVLLLEAAQQREDDALASALRWREKAVQAWSDSSAGGSFDSDDVVQLHSRARHLDRELEATRRTFSWRVTAPLRTIRRILPVQEAR